MFNWGRSATGTLRARLTLWYILLLGITLFAFGFYLYARLENSLLEQVDTSLQIAASQALNNLNDQGESPAFANTDHSQTMERRLGQAGVAVRLISRDGTLLDGFGSYRDLPDFLPVENGFRTLEADDEETTWRIYSQFIQDEGQTIGWLQSAQRLNLVKGASDSLLQQMFIGLPLILVLTGVGGLFLADRALRPIDLITRTAEVISASDLKQRIHYQGPKDEVGRLAQTFDRMLERLQGSFERERRFTADASHELRTPLTGIKGRIEVTLSTERIPAEYMDTLRDLEQEVNRLIRLTSDLLFLARLDEGQLQLQGSTENISDLLEAIVEQLQSAAGGKGIRIITDIPPDLFIYADTDHLIRLFLNLLDNAIKYTPSKGQITITAKREADEVLVTIADTGPGISAENLPHLFERFYRVEADRSRKTGGVGLGLAIAHEIASWHGGNIKVESESGRGTTFTISLPAVSLDGRHHLSNKRSTG